MPSKVSAGPWIHSQTRARPSVVTHYTPDTRAPSRHNRSLLHAPTGPFPHGLSHSSTVET